MNAGATPAIIALNSAGSSYREWVYPHDPAGGGYGVQAAAKLGRDPGQVFKTLLVSSEDPSRCVGVGIVPVSGRLDLKKTAMALGRKKVALAPAVVAERTSGYAIGGISPLGQRRPLPTVIDSSASTWPTILVSAGLRGRDIEIDPGELARLTAATFAPIAAPA